MHYLEIKDNVLYYILYILYLQREEDRKKITFNSRKTSVLYFPIYCVSTIVSSKMFAIKKLIKIEREIQT